MAESLAVRYRPRRFADVAGQSHVVAVLRSAVTRATPPQQILLAGPSGLGKTTTARIFAAALLCAHRAPDGDACGLCASCLEITGPGGSHPDVIELDAASNGGKDEIRDLAARAVLTPLRGRWKVYIVDEAHGLTGPGGQAFLRLLEEPPGHCLFILATTDPQKLPTALQGRCTYLEVLPPSSAEVRGNLARIARGEDWELPHDVAEAVMMASDPALGMRGTVMTLDKLAGPLNAGQELGAEELEALLGVVDSSRLEAVTSAIVAGDRTAALAALITLSERTGRTHLRRQLTRWARAELEAAVAAGQGVDEAFHRFVTLVEAPSYEGALLVAVARCADPALSGSVDAVRALITRAERTLTELSRAASPERRSTPGPTPNATEEQPPATPLEPAPAARALPRAGSAGGAPRLLSQSDPQVVTLLNAVSKVSGPAAFVLRRSEVHSTGNELRVVVPPSQQAKAAASGLAEALAHVREASGMNVLLSS